MVTNELNFSELSAESRIALRTRLYRQECRAWLLALGLPLIIVLVSDPIFPESRRLAEVLYSVVSAFLAFWVIYPSQTILAELRKTGTIEESKLTERAFDSTWRSVLDFLPPLILPVVVMGGFLVYALLKAM